MDYTMEEKDEEGHRRKCKDTVTDDGRKKKPQVGCNYILYVCYIILKKLYLFYEGLHL
jgi:hypothetical protein